MDSRYGKIADMLITPSTKRIELTRNLSSEICKDGTIAINIIHSFIAQAGLAPEAVRIVDFKKGPEYKAVIDVIKNSILNEFLTANENGNCISFLEHIPLSERVALSDFIASRTGGIA